MELTSVAPSLEATPDKFPLFKFNNLSEELPLGLASHDQSTLLPGSHKAKLQCRIFMKNFRKRPLPFKNIKTSNISDICEMLQSF